MPSHFQAVAELGRHLEAEPPPQRRRQVDGVVLRVRQRPMWAYVLLPTTSATWRARATDADAARTSASVRRSPEFIPRYRYAHSYSRAKPQSSKDAASPEPWPLAAVVGEDERDHSIAVSPLGRRA